MKTNTENKSALSANNGSVSGEAIEGNSNQSSQTAENLIQKVEPSPENETTDSHASDIVATPAETPSVAGARSEGVSSKVGGDLTITDIEKREKWEGIVDRGYKTLIEIAEALHHIKTYKNGILYSDYDNWEQYCQTRWSYNKTQAYRLVEAGEFIETLEKINSPHGESDRPEIKKPLNEIQVRALKGVPKELRAECWMDIVTHRDPSELSRKDIEAEARLFLQRRRIQKKSSSPRPTAIASAKRKIEELNRAFEKLDDPDKFKPLIDQLLELLDASVQSPAIEVAAVEIKGEPEPEELDPDQPTDADIDRVIEAQREREANHDGSTHISFAEMTEICQQAIKSSQQELTPV